MNTPSGIENYMTKYPVFTTRRASVQQAQQLMDQYRIRHLPVIEDKKVLGIVSLRDLQKMEPFFDSMTLVVSDVMVPNPYLATKDTPVSEVTEKMASEKFGCTVIVDSEKNIIGIFTVIDALKLLTSLMKAKVDPKTQPTLRDCLHWDNSLGE